MPDDPLWINASAGAPAYAANELRRGFAAVLFPGHADRFGARAGIRPGGSAAVTISGMTVTVQHLTAVVYPALTSLAGPYLVQLQSEQHTVSPADGTNPRKDIIYLQVQDNDEDSSGFRRARSVYLAGTPAPSPVEPTPPIGAYRIASIDVPAGSTTPTLTYNAPWTVASGGIVPVRNDAELPGSTGGLYDGAARWNQDLDRLEVHNGGSAWETVGSVKGYQVFLEERFTAGTTWDPAASSRKGWRRALVETQAAGGAGGGAAATAVGETSSGGGGQGGAYARKWVAPVDVPSPVTITVGAGGTGVSGGGGNTGGTSSFGGTLVSADGGIGGGSVGASGTINGSAGGNSLQSTNGDIGIGGQGGSFGFKGGASGGAGGLGGSSHMGGGGASRTSSGTGLPGRNYGGGGGGALNGASQLAAAGGAGAGGIVIVTLFV